jgi:hypothetical protein
MNGENVMVVVDVLKALLTPAIAVLTAVIAVAQSYLAKAKYRHELYERRSAIYKATMKFIAQVTSKGLDLTEAHTLRDTSEVAFLFKGKQIPAFLEELYEKTVDLDALTNCFSSEMGRPTYTRNALTRCTSSWCGLVNNLMNANASLAQNCRWSSSSGAKQFTQAGKFFCF